MQLLQLIDVVSNAEIDIAVSQPFHPSFAVTPYVSAGFGASIIVIV